MNVLIRYWIVELALAVLGLLGILWDKVIAKRRENRRILEVLNHEREPDTLTREILEKKLILRFLAEFAWCFPVLAGLHLFLRGLNASDPGLPAWGPGDLPFWGPIVLMAAVTLYMLFGTLRKVLAVRRGKFQVRRLTLAGVKTERSARGVESSREYLGKRKGDLFVPSPVPLKIGLWYYVLLIRGEAALVLPAELWQPDLDLPR